MHAPLQWSRPHQQCALLCDDHLQRRDRQVGAGLRMVSEAPETCTQARCFSCKEQASVGAASNLDVGAEDVRSNSPGGHIVCSSSLQTCRHMSLSPYWLIFQV